ncbi:MAG: SDR family oxidoreductase [Candidatus Calescibacterium sp.]|nr:SDR family oxidoreductase [Candidatus Calescibacterium sp.]MCX7972730.1 SDR family oxidoreductase [bacterium]MDW8195534.1 SDR family oxidoreductase [Candidatus Calescibacterium sp.]
MLKAEEVADLVRDPISLSGWAIILGASSGFGAATSITLAKAGMNIIGVHLDRKSTLPNALEVQKVIQNLGKEAIFYNTNAADMNKVDEIITEINSRIGKRSIRVLLHSLAFGTLKPYIGEDCVSKEQMEMTLDVMANSLVYWVQKLFKNDMFSENARIFAMTSIGSSRNWKSYGPVSAAKAVLEAHIRQLALELAPYGITANAICAGVTKTPALMKIPGHEDMIEKAEKYNPSRRLTEPIDVANAIMLLSHPASYWITGNTIYVDGGEFLT